jgi:hypothetical protein
MWIRSIRIGDSLLSDPKYWMNGKTQGLGYPLVNKQKAIENGNL